MTRYLRGFSIRHAGARFIRSNKQITAHECPLTRKSNSLRVLLVIFLLDWIVRYSFFNFAINCLSKKGGHVSEVWNFICSNFHNKNFLRQECYKFNLIFSLQYTFNPPETIMFLIRFMDNGNSSRKKIGNWYFWALKHSGGFHYFLQNTTET